VGWKGPSSGSSGGSGVSNSGDVVINDAIVDKQRSRSGLRKSGTSSASSGNIGGDDITREHLQLAKSVLNSFDIVLLTGKLGAACHSTQKTAV